MAPVEVGMEVATEYDSALEALVVKVTGILQRPGDSHRLMRIAGDFARENGCRRVLFDLRNATIRGSTMDTLEVVVKPEEHGFDRSLSVAAVYADDLHAHRFLETVGFNQGALGFRVFDDMEEAREWLAGE